MITQNSKETLKAQADIVDTISNYIELKKAGTNFKAPCPFHGEKTASFVVSPVKQICHCFGCGFSSDIFGFVQEYKKLSFAEAVEEVANDNNFTLEYDNNSEQKDYSSLMEYTNSFYVSNLNKEIHAYLLDRGLTNESIKNFEVGYAPRSKVQLDSLKSQMLNIAESIECGICATEDKGKVYARLTERISFPIRNHTGKLIGFGGRIIKGDRAKYINSPQTKLFDKSRNLYGYNLAKKAIYDKGTFTITEGYLDVIMFHQAGIHTAVATMGTALTQQHVNIIKKANARVLLCYDGDKAGISAAFKASKLLSAHGVFGGVVLFPRGKDPADMVACGNTQELYEIMKKSTALIKFAVSHIAGNYNLNLPNQKQEALNETNLYLNTLSPLMQDEHKNYVAKTLQVNESHILTTRPIQIQEPILGYINISEMNIIKTACENDRLGDAVLDAVDVNMFEFHQKEFEMMVQRDEKLQGMLLRDELRIYTLEELSKQLKMMKISHYSKQLQIIANSNESYERKSFEIKKVKGIIYQIKKELSRGDKT